MVTTAIHPVDRDMRRRKMPLLLFFWVFALAGCTDVWPQYGLAETPAVSSLEASLARGRDRFAAGHYGLAIAAFRDAIKRDPNSVEALNGLAAAYDSIGRYDLAIYHYERALKVNPDSAPTLNNMGFSYMLQGKFDLATAYLRDAQQRDRSDPAIAANRAVAEAALRVSQPRPRAQWHAPSDRDVRPLPWAWLERTTRVVQTLITQPSPPPAIAAVDTLPILLASPIGDTRMAAMHDRLPRPIAASMADSWVANLPAIANGDEGDEPPG